MTVYVLLGCQEQPNYVDSYGEPAWPSSSVIGVYQDKNRAEAEKIRLEEQDKKTVEIDNCDPCYYLIEERLVL